VPRLGQRSSASGCTSGCRSAVAGWGVRPRRRIDIHNRRAAISVARGDGPLRRRREWWSREPVAGPRGNTSKSAILTQPAARPARAGRVIAIRRPHQQNGSRPDEAHPLVRSTAPAPAPAPARRRSRLSLEPLEARDNPPAACSTRRSTATASPPRRPSRATTCTAWPSAGRAHPGRSVTCSPARKTFLLTRTNPDAPRTPRSASAGGEHDFHTVATRAYAWPFSGDRGKILVAAYRGAPTPKTKGKGRVCEEQVATDDLVHVSASTGLVAACTTARGGTLERRRLLGAGGGVPCR
jgi:hypothetical protein